VIESAASHGGRFESEAVTFAFETFSGPIQDPRVVVNVENLESIADINALSPSLFTCGWRIENFRHYEPSPIF
jgi:hypothetical protein